MVSHIHTKVPLVRAALSRHLFKRVRACCCREPDLVFWLAGLEEMVTKMSIGEKAMFFASYDLGCVRALQVGSTELATRYVDMSCQKALLIDRSIFDS